MKNVDKSGQNETFQCDDPHRYGVFGPLLSSFEQTNPPECLGSGGQNRTNVDMSPSQCAEQSAAGPPQLPAREPESGLNQQEEREAFAARCANFRLSEEFEDEAALANYAEMADQDSNEEPAPRFTLSPKQELALKALLQGRNLEGAARDAGICRRTLRRWMTESPSFQAALNNGHQEARRAATASVHLLAEAAVMAVAKAVLAGDAKIGVQVLRGLGYLAGNPATIGPTDPQQFVNSDNQSQLIEKSLARMLATQRR